MARHATLRDALHQYLLLLDLQESLRFNIELVRCNKVFNNERMAGDHARKRSRDEYERDHQFGVGGALAQIRGEGPSKETGDGAGNLNGTDGADEWQTAESKSSKKRKKLPKKDGGSYPSITHSPNSRLNHFVKLGDLQNLTLYLIADGTSPQWCAVKHGASVRKVVALMVPGLESGMFDGSIPLAATTLENGGGDVENAAAGEGETDMNGDSVKANGESTELASTSDTNAASSRKIFVSPDHYYPIRLKQDRLPGPLQPLADIFEHVWPIKTPGDDKHAKMHSPMAAMLSTPILKTKEEKKAKGPQPPAEGRNWKNQRTPITELVANKTELMEEKYVLHPVLYKDSPTAVEEAASREANATTAESGWVDMPGIDQLWADQKQPNDGTTLQGKNVLAMDCEMCITSAAGTTPQVFSLTRISLIDWEGKTVLDEYVKPAQPITDYLTPYSGITPALLENVTTTLQDIQKKLTTLLTPDTILVGHSLNSDLNALKFTHPYIIDTALLFPHPRGPPLKSSLKWLSQKYLSREIQKGHGSTGHDSIEDARACLDLVKQKCEKGKSWGTSAASSEVIFKRLDRQLRPKRDKVNPIGADESRTGAVVDWGDPRSGYGAQAKVSIGCDSDNEIVAGIKRSLEGDDDDSVVPKGGVDFVFGRLRELEAHQGWWNRSKTLDNKELLSSTTDSNSASSLDQVVSQTVTHIQEIYDSLPPCTALIVFSGSGDPRELGEMQAMQQKFKEEYRVKKWDELSVRWTDEEEQKLRTACEVARKGVGLIAVK